MLRIGTSSITTIRVINKKTTKIELNRQTEKERKNEDP